MKIFKSSRVALVLGSTVLIGVPTSVLLPGCGGGGGSNSPTISAALYTVPVQLSASQAATLNVSVDGVKVSGSLVVPTATPIPQTRSSAAIPVLPAGEYKLTGNSLPPRGFGLTGDFPAPVGTITITGQVPTATEPGSYSISIGGSIIEGVIPILSPTATPIATVTGTPHATGTPSATAVPTNTPVPTATPVSTGNGLKLTYSQQAIANDVPTSATIPLSFGQANVSGGTLTCIFEEPTTSPSPRHSMQFELRGKGALVAGLSYPMSGTTAADYFELVTGGNNRKWESTSGTIKITSVSAGTGNTTNVQLTITDGHFKAAAGFPSTGTFVLNGTAKFSAPNGSGEG